MKLHVWKTVSGLFFTVAVAAVGGGSTGAELGCSTTASGSASSSGSSGGGSSGGHGSSSGVTTPPNGCTADASVVCVTGADGFSCPTSDNPEASDPTLSCSTPTDDGAGNDLYCCFTDPGFPASTCTPDDEITSVCPDPTSYGYVCESGDDPTSYDSYLVCSTPTPDADGVHDDYCCTYDDTGSGSSSGGTVPAGCTLDASLDCVGGADGYACDIGSNPEDEDPGLSCSTPALASGEDDYCCYSGGTWSDTTCSPDDGLTEVCPDPTSYGYVCVSGDDPTSYDATLTCSDATPDADGVHDDFCCTY